MWAGGVGTNVDGGCRSRGTVDGCSQYLATWLMEYPYSIWLQREDDVTKEKKRKRKKQCRGRFTMIN